MPKLNSETVRDSIIAALAAAKANQPQQKPAPQQTAPINPAPQSQPGAFDQMFGQKPGLSSLATRQSPFGGENIIERNKRLKQQMQPVSEVGEIVRRTFSSEPLPGEGPQSDRETNRGLIEDIVRERFSAPKQPIQRSIGLGQPNNMSNMSSQFNNRIPRG